MTIVAINLFQNSREDANRDLIRQDMLEAATIAQAYFKKHPALGGGGNSFVGISLDQIGLDSTNVIASFEVTSTSIGSFTLSAEPIGDSVAIVAIVYPSTIDWQ